ncbi:hypothetical protein JW859_05565 [bacterium]|nr:hypothetical protein [bacterium]
MERKREVLLALCLAWLVLAGCGGSQSQVAELTGGDLEQISEQSNDTQLPAMPDDAVAGSAELPRFGSVLQYMLLGGDEPLQISGNAVIDTSAHNTYLDGSTEYSWAIYDFYCVNEQEIPALVELQMAVDVISSVFIGFSDYSTGNWFWREFPYMHAPLRVPVLPGESAISSTGHLFMAIVAPIGQGARIDEAKLVLDAFAPHPVNLQASGGEAFAAIELSWDDPTVTYLGFVYDSIQLLRYDPETSDWLVIATLPAHTTSYRDVQDRESNPIPYDEDVDYSIRTIVDTQTGPASPAVTGRRYQEGYSFTASQDAYADRIELAWDEIPEADGYDLYYAEEGTDWEPLASLDGSSATAFTHAWNAPSGNECAVNTVYNYKLQPSTEPDSDQLPQTSGSRLVNYPNMLMASYGEYTDRIVLNWNDTNAAAVGYKIYRDSQDASGVVGSVIGTQTWEDTDVDENQHIYWLRPYIGSEEYMFSWHAVGSVLAAGWSLHTLAAGAEVRHIAVASTGNKPAFCCVTNNLNVIFAQADSDAPASSADWTMYELESDDGTYRAAMVQPALFAVNDRPVAFYAKYGVDDATDSLVCAQASTAEPMGKLEWSFHELDSDANRSYCIAGAAALENRPMVAYNYAGGSINPLYFARAVVDNPSSASDWAIHDVVSDEVYGYGLYAGVADGKPVVTYDQYPDEPYIGLATTSAPETHWDWQAVQLPQIELILNGALTKVNGRYNLIGQDSSSYDGKLLLATAADGSQTDSESWQATVIDGYATPAISPDLATDCQLLVDQANRLLVIYEDDNTRTIRTAQALADNPQGPEDWELRTIWNASIGGMTFGATYVAGHPIVVVTEGSDIICLCPEP